MSRLVVRWIIFHLVRLWLDVVVYNAIIVAIRVFIHQLSSVLPVAAFLVQSASRTTKAVPNAIV